MNENELSYKIIGLALELHKKVGPGLLESTYENALAYDLREAGLEVRQQVQMPFVYKEIKMDVGYRIDLLVEHKVYASVTFFFIFLVSKELIGSNLASISSPVR
jgi:GxxExxY protein